MHVIGKGVFVMPEDSCLREPGLYAVVPMNVLMDDALRPNAKLLYGMISSLATARGYCWAKNQYLGNPLGLDGKTVSALLRNLSARGYIRVEVNRDASIVQGTERKIYIATFALASEAPPPPKKEGPGASKKRTPPLKNEVPPPQNCGEGGLQNAASFIGSINKRDNTPYSPPEEVSRLIETFTESQPQLADVMAEFMENRADNSKAKSTPAAIKAVISRLEKYSGGSVDVMWDMLSLAASRHWITVYPPKAPPRSSADAPREGEWV